MADQTTRMGSTPLDGNAGARGVVLMVRAHRGPAHLDEEGVAVALHGRGVATVDVILPAAQGGADASAAALEQALMQLPRQQDSRAPRVGLCAGRDAAAPALELAARLPDRLQAIVLLAGQLDKCTVELGQVRAPTLMLVGPGEFDALAGNRSAAKRLGGAAQIEVLPDEGRVFAASGLGSRRAELAADWFCRHLEPAPPQGASSGRS